jgi:membrane protein DedA with SNARE-associated domain
MSTEADRRRLYLLIVPIVGFVILGNVGNALTFSLIKDHPLGLLFLDARNRNLLAVAGRTDLWPYLVVGSLRRMASDPLFFLLGHWYGHTALRWAERQLGAGGFLVGITHEWFRRAALVVVFFFPGAVVCVLAGASRMKVWMFLAANVLGTLTMVLLMRELAFAFEEPIDRFLDFTDRNVKWMTAGTIAAVAGVVLYQRSRGTGELQELQELAREVESDEPK